MHVGKAKEGMVECQQVVFFKCNYITWQPNYQICGT